MKKRGFIALFVVVTLFVGCFKDVSYDTSYVLKPTMQENSGDPVSVIDSGRAQAFAYAADTAVWTVASYDDALAGIITNRDNAADRQTTPLVTAERFEQYGIVDLLRMQIKRSKAMIVAVDTKNKLYGYTLQEIPENLAQLPVTVVFKPWKEGLEYKDGKWVFLNDFYVPPTILKCYVTPTVQPTDGAEPTAPTKLKAYAYGVDTTSWRIASYVDAVGGVITLKSDTTQTRSNPDFTAFKETTGDHVGEYGMEVSKSPLMVVVVDQTNEIYAYSKQTVDLDGSPVTFPVVFRPWRQDSLYVEEGWRYVNHNRTTPAPTKPQRFFR